MAGNIQVPNNIEDKTVLKRFLTDLVLGINGNSLFSGSIQEQNAALVEIIQNNPTLNFLDITSKLTELRKDILTYVEDNIETVILQNTEDIALIAEQFGTFYNQALAASWYGLSVKAGGAIAGLEVGSLDPDVVTPGDESSYFRIIANNFILGRAYEDLTQEEKNYLAANNLPNFGTVYNAQKQPIPALITSWDSASQVYKHYFNGIVQFSNVQNMPVINKTYIQATAPTSGMIAGDTWLNTSASYSSYNYNGSSWISTGNKTYIQTTQPTFGCVSGDIWIDSDDNNRSYRYNGSSWTDTTINPAAIINNGTTTINGGKITTNSLAANTLMPATGGTTVWSGGALISQNFNGNAVGSIGSPTQGFRLSSNATGTFDDPNIFGAYIRGSIVDVSTMYSRAPNHPSNLGKVIRFQTNGSVIMPGVGTGFASNRVCSRSESALKLEGWYVAATNYLVAWLQYSIDGGINWTTFKTKQAAMYGYQEAFYIYFSELFDLSLVTDSNTVTFRITGSAAGTASDILISIYNN